MRLGCSTGSIYPEGPEKGLRMGGAMKFAAQILVVGWLRPGKTFRVQVIRAKVEKLFMEPISLP